MSLDHRRFSQFRSWAVIAQAPPGTGQVSGRYHIGSALSAVHPFRCWNYAAEYGGDTAGRYSPERVRYAALLHQLAGKPLLATGGAPLGNAFSEVAQMKTALEKDFRVPGKWVEEASNNARENAHQGFAMLKKNGITHIMLVSHA